jgi:uncharacterized membrane protein (DUF485 family)
MTPISDSRLRELDRARWQMGLALTAAVTLIYFGFIALVAFGRPILAIRVMPGLSLGILLGALVILASWILTWFYIWWANTYYDPRVQALNREAR